MDNYKKLVDIILGFTFADVVFENKRYVTLINPIKEEVYSGDFNRLRIDVLNELLIIPPVNAKNAMRRLSKFLTEISSCLSLDDCCEYKFDLMHNAFSFHAGNLQYILFDDYKDEDCAFNGSPSEIVHSYNLIRDIEDDIQARQFLVETVQGTLNSAIDDIDLSTPSIYGEKIILPDSEVERSKLKPEELDWELWDDITYYAEECYLSGEKSRTLNTSQIKGGSSNRKAMSAALVYYFLKNDKEEGWGWESKKTTTLLDHFGITLSTLKTRVSRVNNNNDRKVLYQRNESLRDVVWNGAIEYLEAHGNQKALTVAKGEFALIVN